MQLDNCQKAYIYQLIIVRQESLERRICKLTRYVDRDEPVQKWLYELAHLRHENRKLQAALLLLEEEMCMDRWAEIKNNYSE